MPAEKGHPNFKEPSDPNIKVWRYMDFTKYVSLLDTRSLYFARADKFDDPFEGSYSHANINLRPSIYSHYWAEMDPAARERALASMSRAAEWSRQWTFINCWHMNEYESAAMWALYARSSEAIAIQSTYNRLHTCLPSGIFVGEVQYIDYTKDWLPEGNTFAPFVHKRKSFEHERELRAVIQDLPIEDVILVGKQNPEPGRSVHVDLDTLLEAVYIAPSAPSWFRSLVASITRKYGLDTPIVHSSLDAKPVY